jgi:hypothetical protein
MTSFNPSEKDLNIPQELSSLRQIISTSTSLIPLSLSQSLANERPTPSRAAAVAKVLSGMCQAQRRDTLSRYCNPLQSLRYPLLRLLPRGIYSLVRWLRSSQRMSGCQRAMPLLCSGGGDQGRGSRPLSPTDIWISWGPILPVSSVDFDRWSCLTRRSISIWTIRGVNRSCSSDSCTLLEVRRYFLLLFDGFSLQ